VEGKNKAMKKRDEWAAQENFVGQYICVIFGKGCGANSRE